ncbi:MAG: rRNA pseudouridine synthase [Gemmatimonadetes bacterium]|nr:rRNA pseudouridine synthase [Gemmatimonadota bacterium]
MADLRPEAVSVARALSKLGWCSRAQAQTLVVAGRVSVDGNVVTDPSFRLDMKRSRITVDGVLVRPGERVHLMMNKPAGYVTTTSDERGRQTVYDLLDADTPRVNAVGRLDMQSEGLLLFTNDTRWADRINDPRTHIDKVYEVRLACAIADADLERALAGVDAGRGEVLRFKAVSRMSRGDDWIEVVLDEGRNRQIRRVLESLGCEIVRLIRTSVGPVRLGSLEPGAVRALTSGEKRSLEVTG